MRKPNPLESAELSCPGCTRIEKWKNQDHEGFITELKTSLLFLGSHQYFKGYSVLFLKEHYRDLIDLPPDLYKDMCEDLRIASAVLNKVFQPWKLNYSCYGNQVQHIHWHIFPRYQTEKDHLQPPWIFMDEFNGHKPSDDEKFALIGQIRQGFVHN